MRTAATYIVLLLLLAINMPGYAQYYSGTNYQNPSNYAGFGGRTSYDVSGLHAIAQPKGNSAHHAMASHPSYQSSTSMNTLEQALNTIDTREGWSSTPVSMPATPQSRPMNYGASNRTQSQSMSQSVGILPRVTRRDLTRVFIEGGSVFDSAAAPVSGGFGAGADRARGTAYSCYQRAENLASKAHSLLSRARYDEERWSKKNAADQAYYAANDARIAADEAYSAAASGDSQARNYANLARDAANRARADADRAKYFANTEYR